MTEQYYPILLSLGGLSCLVVGFGDVGRRKVAMILPARPARIVILDPVPPAAEGKVLLEEARASGIDCVFSDRPFSEANLEGMTLVFACAGDHGLNARIAKLCRERHLLCNCVDNPPAGSFHVPVVVRETPLTAALSTDRASPALARRWKAELAAFLAPKAPVAMLMGRLRPPVLALGLPPEENRAIFRRLAAPELEAALAKGALDQARLILEAGLPEALRPKIPFLLDHLLVKEELS